MITAGRLSPAQRFGARFFAVLLLMSVAVWLLGLDTRLGAVQRALARCGAWLARLAGARGTVDGDTIQVDGLMMEINFECTGVYVLLILVTFLVAYPSSWYSRVLGSIIGILGLTAVNVFRIAVLVRVTELQPALFDYLHEYVWQGIFLVLVIVYAMSWVDRVK